MPSTYAHYRFGQQILNDVGKEQRKLIKTHKELFLIGLHGPDILFYYKPLKSNKVNEIGYNMHKRSGQEFFTNAVRVIKSNRAKDAHLAYVYGVICHFALDVTCHGYIDRKIAQSDVSHTEIEVEFDRRLMIMDGLNPIKQNLTGHINPSKKNSKVIKDFFPNTTAVQVEDALKGMIFYNKLLVAPSKLKRNLIYLLLKATGNYKEMHGLIVNYHKNPNCNDSTLHLLTLYNRAKELAVNLIEEYDLYLKGMKRLDSIYCYTFGSQLLEREEKNDEIQINTIGTKLGAL